jgi:hypothetical protein
VEEFEEAECVRHGLDRHVLVHEAGHAVAAMEHDIAFERIASYEGETSPTFMGGLFQAVAAIEMSSPDPRSWVRPNPPGALRFVLAGSLAEIALLGHALPDGYREDVKQWRRGLDSYEAITLDELDVLAGQPMSDVISEVQDWASDNAGRIQALSKFLARLSRPLAVPHEDVAALLRREA